MVESTKAAPNTIQGRTIMLLQNARIPLLFIRARRQAIVDY